MITDSRLGGRRGQREGGAGGSVLPTRTFGARAGGDEPEAMRRRLDGDCLAIGRRAELGERQPCLERESEALERLRLFRRGPQAFDRRRALAGGAVEAAALDLGG